MMSEFLVKPAKIYGMRATAVGNSSRHGQLHEVHAGSGNDICGVPCASVLMRAVVFSTAKFRMFQCHPVR